MQPIEQVTGTGVPLLLDDIDTDRIIPARYLKCVTFEGLGPHVFEDDRKQDPSHPFEGSRFQEGSILVAGRNFGCGSSREHAPQALIRWGIGAVVAESFGEIFFGNCSSLGVPAVCASRDDLKKLAAAIHADPQLEITLDLTTNSVRYGEESMICEIPESVRTALLSGQWDFLSQLLEAKDEIRRITGELPYRSQFRV